ncbi:hypothetical protein MCOR02_004194 [Pyricularia oryzae]|nr:hypothetical protein MCOR02_004194 [Pyricularia oryzae]
MTGSSPEHEFINANRWKRMAAILVHKCNSPYFLCGSLRNSSQWILCKQGLFPKVERMTTLAEAHAVIFLARHINIPVPKIQCAFVHQGHKYIVMSRISGDQLPFSWHKRVARCAPIQQRYGGRRRPLWPLFDPRLDTPFGNFGGPFESARKFHGAFLADHDVDFDDPRIKNEDLVKLISCYRAEGDNVVLIHANIRSMNIIADGDEGTGIVDSILPAGLGS